jgi:hypothetical protein
VRVGARSTRASALLAVVSSADPPDRERLEARLERAGNACGCSTGGIALFVALAAAVVWWGLAHDARVALWPEAVLAGLLVVAATLAGKLAGLATADVWLWWVGRRFRPR